MSQSTLTKLICTTRPIIPAIQPIQVKREKLIARLNEQCAMVACLLENEVYTAYKEVRITDGITGEKKRVKQPKKLRQWFYQVNDIWFFEIKYGNKSLELQKGKVAIEVGKQENLLTTIDTLIQAVEKGELDTQLKAVTGPRKAKV
ncbi:MULTISPECIES: DUF6641 family protein [Pseudoalteromonas]|uniref:Uncharacterized protein n=1 Tax=Pseudoalteromonas lipolytica TaxID=570156 RepID=A0A0N8HKI0_9GAMM|nr:MULTISPECIES: DUF6641 family protein [Pseudoalteromonas]KPM83936.1 hypothetical protein AOG27_09855 [Pseudoalteromonas lipolytica]